LPYKFIVKKLLGKNLNLNLKAQFCLIDAAEVGNLDTRQRCNSDTLLTSLEIRIFKS